MEGAPQSAGSDHPLVARLGHEAIRRAVEERYSAVAEAPQRPAGFPVGREFARSVGYPAEFLDSLPPECAAAFTGAGNPHAYVDLRGVGSLLDLGCGAGLDLIRYAAEAPGPLSLMGLDFSRSMVGAARANLAAAGVDARVFRSSADRIPLPDAGVDRVTANGIFNLSPDKGAIAREAFRVLRPGGQIVFAEIILVDNSARPAESLDEWFRCTGGALTGEALSGLLVAAGFESVTIHETTRNARTGHAASRSAVVSATRPVSTAAGQA